MDGHPDHEACGAAVAAACPPSVPRAEYPVWAWHWLEPSQFPTERARRVDLDPAIRHRKATALEKFRSQTIGRGPIPPVLPADVLAHFRRPFEVLVEASP